MDQFNENIKTHQGYFRSVYKIPYRRARAWPSVQPLGRVRRASKARRYLAYNCVNSSMINVYIFKECL